MPALPFAELLNSLIARDPPATNVAAADALQVICAWPVSGQYGPGSRALYYALVATCVIARKAEWLKQACLAAALLFPAIAAIHGIVLAALHKDGAIDMDIYGTFQLCSIGILAAPVTAKLSRTYFYDPSRNLIFVWTGLILAGLLSLTVEFFRSEAVPCTPPFQGKPVSTDPGQFPYGFNCGLICDPNIGPISPLRGGSANNIYVIPVPERLTFGTATLLAAACCVPAILSLISMWNKILEINWKRRWGQKNEIDRGGELIEGTNGATIDKMNSVNGYVRRFLSAVEIPIFGAAVCCILIIGELNLFSHQVFYQTEPIASIGQWAPIAGTTFALLGSLYLLVTAKGQEEKEIPTTPESFTHQCTCNHQMREISSRPSLASSRSGANSPVAHGGDVPIHLMPTATQSTSEPSHQAKLSWAEITDAGSRRKVARMLNTMVDRIGTPAADRFDDSAFKHGKAADFPQIPGEANRNVNLPQILDIYNQDRDADGNVTPSIRRQSSRTGSFTGSIASRSGDRDGESPHAHESMSPSSSPPISQRPRINTVPADGSSFELEPAPSSFSTGGSATRQHRRSDTLELPSPIRRNTLRNSLFANNDRPIDRVVTISRGQDSPAIVISPDPGTSSKMGSPTSHE